MLVSLLKTSETIFRSESCKQLRTTLPSIMIVAYPLEVWTITTACVLGVLVFCTCAFACKKPAYYIT